MRLNTFVGSTLKEKTAYAYKLPPILKYTILNNAIFEKHEKANKTKT